MTHSRFVLWPLAVALVLGGCATGEPIVPREISTIVNDQGRERTYDLAWQDIRRFEGALRRGENRDYPTEALVILSRMNRLAEGTAGAVRDTASRETLTNAAQIAMGAETEDNLAALRAAATQLREAFDRGDFASAQQHALECLAYARANDGFTP